MMGIGGIGMSGIAGLLLEKGDKVTGCDSSFNRLINRLTGLGADIRQGHDPLHITDSVDLVVHTSAVKDDHPELVEARRKSVTVYRRAQMLSDIVKDKSVIAVTGTHGKTTTSFMITHIMNYSGLNPGFVIGGEVESLGGNARWGSGKYFVLEADESDGTQVFINPNIAVVTNIDYDHMEYYSSLSHIAGIMKKFLDKIPADGVIVGCGDDIEVKRLLESTNLPKLSYGFNPIYDVYASDVKLNGKYSSFKLWYKGKMMGDIYLNIPGRHNILNALAGIGVSIWSGIPFESIALALKTYPGVKRRLDIVFKNEKFTVMDDYAHHPSEIKAVVDTLSRMAEGRRIGVFQPHRYTRTKLLAKEFGGCFEGLDKLILTDIYPAGEKPMDGITGKLIYDEVVKFGSPETVYIESKNNILEYIIPQITNGDTVVFMGAGDVTELAHSFRQKSI
jgi:UDP-N-acetylmuramate--alanine ligase